MANLQTETSPHLINRQAAAEPPLVYRSDELLQGRREVLIEHAGQVYRLRLTSAHKLYLTK
jgi:hemin uptake protein HemP